MPRLALLTGRAVHTPLGPNPLGQLTPRDISNLSQFHTHKHRETHTQLQRANQTTKRTNFAAINQIKRGPSTRTFNKDLRQAADLEVNLSLTELIEIFSAVAVCGGVDLRTGQSRAGQSSAGVAAAEI